MATKNTAAKAAKAEDVTPKVGAADVQSENPNEVVVGDVLPTFGVPDLGEKMRATLKEGGFGVSDKLAAAAAKAFCTAIIDLAASPGNVYLPGVGTFKVSFKEAHEARNPSTGGTVMVDPHYAVKFSLAKTLKDAVNNLEIVPEVEAA